jgi:hypothetical protein
MRIMPLQSKLFKGDQRLEACLIHDSAHVTPGTAGEFVTKIQKALFILDGAVIDPSEQGIYGPSTADAVLAYKKRRKIINYSYQTQADDIVGKMTIASLDNELTQVRLVPVNPRWRDQIVRTGRQQRQGEFQSRLLLGFGISTGAPSAVPIGSPTTFDLGDHSISAKPEMPPELSPIEIKIDGVSPDPTPNTFFDWEVRVVFDESSTTFGRAATVFNDGFTVSRVLGGTFSFSWPWIRGGNLTMHVEGQVRGGSVEATFTGRITGTDPAIGDVRAALGDDTLRRIANVESGFHQFETDPNSGRVVPKFNFRINAQGQRVRGDGGAGICQITPPTANEIWDWKANVRKGKQIFGGALGAAAAYLGQHAQNGQFVNSLGLPNAEAIRREAIQNFNGGHFWQWNPAGNRWEASPPNNYVDLVLNASP